MKLRPSKGDLIHGIVHLFIGETNSFMENYKYAHKVYTHNLHMIQGHCCLFFFFLATQVVDFVYFITSCLKASSY
jgi:hypothetical protein